MSDLGSLWSGEAESDTAQKDEGPGFTYALCSVPDAQLCNIADFTYVEFFFCILNL